MIEETPPPAAPEDQTPTDQSVSSDDMNHIDQAIVLQVIEGARLNGMAACLQISDRGMAHMPLFGMALALGQIAVLTFAEHGVRMSQDLAAELERSAQAMEDMDPADLEVMRTQLIANVQQALGVQIKANAPKIIIPPGPNGGRRIVTP